MRHILLGLGMATMLSACGDPLRDVTRLSDVAVADNASSVAETPSEARTNGGGLFGRLLNRQPDDPTNAAIEAALADADLTVDGVESPAEDPVAISTAPQAERRGLFGLFGGGADPELEVTEVTENPTTAGSVATVVPASALAQPEPAPRRGFAGLFGGNRDVPRTGPDASDVTAGAVMPFGQIARVCGVSGRDLGAQVDAGGGFRIYDTIPNSTAPRPFYITGFDDNCARTFTGAVVVTGDASTHEFVRYRPSNERIGYTTTDNAYEALKASVCRVGRGQPCGDRIIRMNSNTQFITVYNFFGGTFSSVPTRWSQILIHDGEVLAMSIKDGQQ